MEMIRLDNWHMDGADNKCILQDVSCMEWIDLVSSVLNHTQFYVLKMCLQK
jgi:hypothetical protein